MCDSGIPFPGGYCVKYLGGGAGLRGVSASGARGNLSGESISILAPRPRFDAKRLLLASGVIGASPPSSAVSLLSSFVCDFSSYSRLPMMPRMGARSSDALSFLAARRARQELTIKVAGANANVTAMCFPLTSSFQTPLLVGTAAPLGAGSAFVRMSTGFEYTAVKPIGCLTQ
ncbi:uncharacterized protein PITG_02689 [Phytophthora infestans T30-4]|uniref:Uncharacterized protein n=1 Tax=Phytophthora infestans (strain T30-4) TaxID=403677 RepID=D0MWZ5_PHYIT|nr:uncharacterized protein PITG_02689 [Phytophthora infestans T30-4]EEY64158.1 hypothetical protein PITG_02689 [Phytophthora infestans T30-4]|eukprot:XP_002907594.1 hypothetical protein PITG_02689 [Phytophthora infestans T30-4]